MMSFTINLTLSRDTEEVVVLVSQEVFKDVAGETTVSRYYESICEAFEEYYPVYREDIEVRSSDDRAEDAEDCYCYWAENSHYKSSPPVAESKFKH